ncbi:MAG: hypothetical protein J0H54_02205, partial [Rhizobiales bacterium]|nr:hypothetical protein [Hyphomicrobiales bacterium]
RLTDSVTERLAGVSEGIVDRISGLSEGVADRLTGVSDGIALRLAGVADDVADRMVRVTSETGERFAVMSDDVTGKLAGLAGEVEQSLTGRALAAATAIEQRTQTLNDVLGHRSSEIARLLDGEGSRLVTALDQRGDELTRRVASVGDAVVDLLSSKGSEVVSLVLSTTDQAARALVDGGENVSRSFGLANERLRTDVADYVERLAQSNDLLTSLLSKTTDNLNHIETGLAARTSEFAASIESAVGNTQSSSAMLAEHVAMLRDVSKDVLDNVGVVADRFETQGRTLQDAARDLSKANADLEGGLDERRLAVEHLAATLASRSGELDQRMKSFTETVSASLRDAEERAAAVSRSLAPRRRGASSSSSRVSARPPIRPAPARWRPFVPPIARWSRKWPRSSDRRSRTSPPPPTACAPPRRRCTAISRRRARS